MTVAAPLTPATVLRKHPHAVHLSVGDGRVPLGIVLDTRRPVPRSPQAPSFAFDTEDRFVGEFATRRIAAAALGARREHDEAAG